MQMIYPMFALVILTFTVGLSLATARFLSISRGEVEPEYYKLLREGTPPEYVQKLGRNFSNLLEVPLLFYTAAAVSLAVGISGPLLLTMAWLYVGFRVVHSLIHVTYNHPIHRFIAFMGSNLCVFVMWLVIVMRIN